MRSLEQLPLMLSLNVKKVTGSFKVRGALNRIFCVAEAADGVVSLIVTSATGNKAMEVTHALQLRGVADGCKQGCIFLPNSAKEEIVAVLRGYHEFVGLKFTDGEDCLDAERAAKLFYQRETNATYVSRYYDVDGTCDIDDVAHVVMWRLMHRVLDPI
jgi:threonine dehydratase